MALMKYKLCDVVDINARTLKKTDHFSEILYLDTSNITENKIQEIQTFNVNNAPSRAQRRVKDRTIIISMVRPKLRHFGILSAPAENLIVSTGFCTLDIKDTSKIDAYYLYYLLSKQSVVDYLHTIAENSVSAYPSINPSDIGDLSFDFPSIEEQREVSRMLQCMDEKITLNRAINHNLEEQIRLITSRFIYSSRDNEIKYIGDIAKIKASGDCPSVYSKTISFDCNIPIYSNGIENRGLYGYTDKPSISERCITVAARGTIGHCERRLKPFVPVIRLLSIIPNDEGGDIYLHQVISNMRFNKNGSVQQQLTVPEISSIQIPYPNKTILARYNHIVTPIVGKIEYNINECEFLTKQRDELLPLLMNGQVSVNYDLSDY